MRLLPQHESVPIPLEMLSFGDEKDNYDTRGISKDSSSLSHNKKPSSPTTALDVIRQPTTDRSWYFDCLSWSTRCPKDHYVSSAPIHFLHRLTSEQTTTSYRPSLHSQDLCLARGDGRYAFRRRVPTDVWTW